MQPASGLIAWWSLDETSGNIAQDRVGAHPGAYANGPVPADGKVRGALRFDGSNYVAAQDSDEWAFGANDFAIELWANWDAPGSGDIVHAGDIFIGNDEGPGSVNKWFFALGGGVLHFTVYNVKDPPANTYLVRAPFEPVVGEWYHLAITKQGTLFTIFVNGDPIGSEVSTSPIANANAPLTIGQAEELGYMNGRLDEIAIYNRALSQEELQAIYNAGGAGKCLNLPDLSIRPDKGGDTGNVSVRISGSGFAQGATVKLVRAGESDIVGSPVNVEVDGATIETTFALTGQARGVWDLVVMNPDTTVFTLLNGFTIEQGRSPLIIADIVGLPVIRVAREQAYYVFVENVGNINAEFPDSIILISNGVFQQDDPDTVIRAGFVALGATASADPCAWARFELRKIQENLESLASQELETRFRLNGETDPDIRASLERQLKQIRQLIAMFQKRAEDLKTFIAGGCQGNPPETMAPPVIPMDPPIITPFPIVLPEGGCYEISVSVTILGGPTIPLTQTFQPLQAAAVDQSLTASLSTQDKSICTIASFDPNDKIGATGVGPARYISELRPLSYTVFFENLETATAPAQQVVVTDQLDPETMDLNTLTLGPITFGHTLVAPGSSGSAFSSDVDLRPDKNLIVRVEAILDPNTAVLTWRLTSLEPSTGLPPEDPLLGFLPPDSNPPEGDGSVLFTVMPRQGLATGTEIRNKAEIVFDTNPPITTPEWLNTLDNTKPESHVLPLPVTQTSPSFQVEWAGTDDGSGILDYTIFVSEDGGEFTPFLANTTAVAATFNGAVGNTYAFYSVARDQTGNVEDQGAVPEAVTQIEAAPLSCHITCSGDLSGCNDADQCGAHVSFPGPSTTGDCTGLTIACSPASGSFFGLGTTTVNCSAADAAGTSVAHCSFTVTVNDCSPPRITCPGNISRTAAPGQLNVAVAYSATATDNCPDPSVDCTPPSGALFAIGSTTVQCTATDKAGGSDRCSFTVSVTASAASKCPQGQGYWKNHPAAWPLKTLSLGAQQYSQAEALALLQSPTSKDASIILARQLIAAVLNIANGSDPSRVADAIEQSNGLLSGFTGKLPYAISPPSAAGQGAVQAAGVLDEFNSGLLTPGCVP